MCDGYVKWSAMKEKLYICLLGKYGLLLDVSMICRKANLYSGGYGRWVLRRKVGSKMFRKWRKRGAEMGSPQWRGVGEIKNTQQCMVFCNQKGLEVGVNKKEAGARINGKWVVPPPPTLY